MRLRKSKRAKLSPLYLQRAKALQPHVTYKIPTTPTKATKHQQAKVRKLYRIVFGGDAETGRMPPLFVKGKTVKWKSRDPKKMAALKRELGQQTPKELKYIYLRREALPDDPEQMTTPTVTFDPVTKVPIVTNGYTLILTVPFDAQAYSVRPDAEENRVIAELERLFEVVKKDQERRDPPRYLHRKYATFSPMCGVHPYFGGDHDADTVKGRLKSWRIAYWREQRPADSIRQWLTALRLICPFSAYPRSAPSDGVEQAKLEKKRQDALRKKRRRWRNVKPSEE